MTPETLALNGKHVVIIGRMSGIGFTMAGLARAPGATVEIASSKLARVPVATGRWPGVTGHRVDLRSEAGVVDFFGAVDPFDHLAITAGGWRGSMFGAGMIAAVEHGSRNIAQEGSSTLTSGLLAQRSRKGTPLATSMGGAVEHLTRGLTMDLAPVRVNAVSPGLILTEHVPQRPEASV